MTTTHATARLLVESVVIPDGDGVSGAIAKYVLWAMQALAVDGLTARVSAAQIAALTLLHDRHVQRTLARLESLDLIIPVRSWDVDGRPLANSYRVHYDGITRLEALGPDLFGTVPKKSGRRRGDISWSPAEGWAGADMPALRASWIKAYPACDIDRQLAAMDAWLRANPALAAKSNWAAFCVNWLSRSQDRGGDHRGAASGRIQVPTQRRLHEYDESASPAPRILRFDAGSAG